jgi:hypothetical protein
VSRVGGDMSLFRAAARIAWIPAFAGMTGIEGQNAFRSGRGSLLTAHSYSAAIAMGPSRGSSLTAVVHFQVPDGIDGVMPYSARISLTWRWIMSR